MSVSSHQIISFVMIGLLLTVFLSGPAVAQQSTPICEDDVQSYAEYCEERSELNDNINVFINGVGIDDRTETNLTAALIEINALQAGVEETRKAKNKAMITIYDNANTGTEVQAMEKARTIENSPIIEPTSKESIMSYNEIVEEKYNAVRRSVLFPTVGAIFVALIIGTGVGVLIPKKRYSQVKQKVTITADINYSAKVAIIPGILGILLVMAGIGILYSYFDTNAIVEVIL